MSEDSRDMFKDPEKKLADKVEKLNKERVSLEKRIEELENRVTGGTDKDHMTYNFIVEKQMTQMQWNRERDSGASRAEERGLWSPSRRHDRSGHRTSSPRTSSPPYQPEDPMLRGHVVKIEPTSDGYPRAVIGENGEVYIIYSPRDSPSGSNNNDGRGRDERRNAPHKQGEQEYYDNVYKPRHGYEKDKDYGERHKDYGEKDKDYGERRKDYGGKDKDDSYSQDGMGRDRRGRSPDKRDKQGDEDNVLKQRPGYSGKDEEDSSRQVVEGKAADFGADRSKLSDENNRFSSQEDQATDTDLSFKQGDALSIDDDKISRTTTARGYETQTQGTADDERRIAERDKDKTDKDTALSQKTGALESSDNDKEVIIPRVIVVTGFRQDIRDVGEDKPVCSEADQENCQCYKIMRESEEWKVNVTRLLELLVMNAYGNRCPKSLIKALMNPSTREQAIKELLNRTFATDNLSQDNLHKSKDTQHKDTTTVIVKNRADKRDNSYGAMPKTFPQYPPYPKAFESKDSLPRHREKHGQTAASKAGGTSSTPTSQGNKIDIVCPPGTRPVIHIPPSGSPAVTCDMPKPPPPRHDHCGFCSSNDPCEKHR